MLFDIPTIMLNTNRIVIGKVKLDTVLVHSNTSATFFVAAPVCFYSHNPVCYVDTDLRTFNIYDSYLVEFYHLLPDKNEHEAMSKVNNPNGDGRIWNLIPDVLCKMR